MISTRRQNKNKNKGGRWANVIDSNSIYKLYKLACSIWLPGALEIFLSAPP